MTLSRKTLFWTLTAVLSIRLLSLSSYPLMDTTEARYGEMARLMFETGNWITPQFDYGVPFWGKPPLFTWMSAAGVTLFGINEFALRFPHWLAGVFVILILFSFAKRLGISGVVAAIVVASSGMFLIAAGAVMTDMALTLGITIAMWGFYLCWESYDQDVPTLRWAFVGFSGLGVGLLAKGPIVILLVGLAIFPWLVINYGLGTGIVTFWRRIPIIRGLVLMTAIALPWYVLAEQATPGFLDYFFVGEHFKRFVVSGWEGDLYGTAHTETRGTIWLFWVYAAAPWSIILPLVIFTRIGDVKKIISNNKKLFSFLACWMASPLVFFSFAGNILPAYVLPAIPPLGLIFSLILANRIWQTLWLPVAASIAPLLLIVTSIYIHVHLGEKRSDKALLAHSNPSIPIYYIGKRPFSGQFYSHGQAKEIDMKATLPELRSAQFIVTQESLPKITDSPFFDCKLVFEAHSGRSLYECQTKL